MRHVANREGCHEHEIMVMWTCERVMGLSSIWRVLLINNPLLIQWVFQLWDMVFIWALVIFLKKKRNKIQQKINSHQKRRRKCTKNVQVCIASVGREHFSVLFFSPQSAFILVIYAMHLFDPSLCKSTGLCLMSCLIICLSCSTQSVQRFPVTPCRQMKGVRVISST